MARVWKTMYRTRERGGLSTDDSIVVEGCVGEGTEIKLHSHHIDLRGVEQSMLQSAKCVITDAVFSVPSTTGNTYAQFLVAHVVFSQSGRPEDEHTVLHAFVLVSL